MAFPFHLDLLVGRRLVALDLIVVNLQSEVQSEVRLSPHKTGLWCKWLSCGIGKLFSCFLFEFANLFLASCSQESEMNNNLLQLFLFALALIEDW